MTTQTKTKLGTHALLEEIILRSLVEVLDASKKNAKGSDNVLVRDLRGLHANTTKGDLPDHLKKAVSNAASQMTAYIHKEGFSLAPKN